MHYYADEGGKKLMDLMHEFDLQAASTRFCPSCRRDWREWVSSLIDSVVEADSRADSKSVWRLTHRIAGRGTSYSTAKPSASSPAELASMWAKAMSVKFSATPLERSPQPKRSTCINLKTQ